MDPDVFRFASADSNVLPFPVQRSEVAYQPNGWQNVYDESKSLSQRRHHKEDIAERNMDPVVWKAASSDTSVMPFPNPHLRPINPYHYNGDIPW